MPTLDAEGNVLADTTWCAGLRADLKNCLLASDCVKKSKKTPRECLVASDVPPECSALRNAFFECKRSLLDNRQRFRGKKVVQWVNMPKEKKRFWWIGQTRPSFGRLGTLLWMTLSTAVPIGTGLLMNKIEVDNLVPMLEVKRWDQLSLRRSLLRKTKIEIINGTRYDKVKVLKLIIEATLPADLIPVKYQVDGKDTFFLARNCGPAIKAISELALTVTCPNTKKQVVLKLMLCYLTLSEAPMVMRKHILNVNLCRFNHQQRILDFSEYHNDPQLKEIFCPLSLPKSMRYVLELCRQYLYHLTMLVLSSNSLTTLEHLEPLTECKTLKSLDVRDNELDWDGLSKIPQQFRLKDIWLDGNPLCSNYSTPAEYINHVKAIIPSLESLDDQSICGVVDLFELMPRNFLVKPSLSCLFVDQFLEHFFKLFEGRNRSSLIRMYHPKALFSMSMTVLQEQATAQNSSLNTYMEYSRNLLKMSDYSKLYQQLKSGPYEIFTVFNDMPQIQIDPYSVKVDVPVFEENRLALVNVSGVFREMNGVQVYFFHRSFILNPCRVNAGEWKIVNDMLSITNATFLQANKSFTMLQNKVSGGIENEKDKLVSIVSDITTMNTIWAERFLQNASWDLEATLQAFTDQLKAEQIPTKAFDKLQ